MPKRLTRITTRVGDRGQTRLGDGGTRRKSDARIEAIGAVDELNAHLGVLLARLEGGPMHAQLAPIQHRLFDLGGALSVPGAQSFPRAAVADLERDAEALNAELPELENFVLPGGTLAAAEAHVSRTVCRRAERAFVRLADAEPDADDPALGVYLNRLSDLLFIVARHLARANGGEEVMWEPAPRAT